MSSSAGAETSTAGGLSIFPRARGVESESDSDGIAGEDGVIGDAAGTCLICGRGVAMPSLTVSASFSL
jgi:hypothetical protein